MSDFNFLAVSNIEGMRFLRYIKILGIGVVFGVSLFFLIYFIIKDRRKKILKKKFTIYDHKSLLLSQDLLRQNIINASGKLKVSLFIEYLEKFVTTTSIDDWPLQPYANISELLSSQWVEHLYIQEIESVLYAHQKASQQLEVYIHEKIRVREKK